MSGPRYYHSVRPYECLTGSVRRRGRNRTRTPELSPAVLERPAKYAGLVRHHFRRPKQVAYCCGAYLQGLLLDGERKGIEPMSRPVHFPEGVRPADPDQALRQFLGQSPRDDGAVLRTYRSAMTEAFVPPAGLFVVDDTGLPKQGQHSVGVAHRYCGALGRKANCQVATSLQYVGPRGHFPPAMRLYPPGKWAEDAERLVEVGVPWIGGGCSPRGRSAWSGST